MSQLTDSLYQQWMEAKADVQKIEGEILGWEKAITMGKQKIARQRALMKEIDETLATLGTSVANAAPRPPWPGGSKSLGVL